MGEVYAPAEWKAHPRFVRVLLKPLVTREMNPDLTLNLVRVAPGGEITRHVHDASTETFYILAGRGVSWIGAEQFDLAPGVCGYAPPGVAHSVCNTGDADLEALSIFNPPLP